MGRGLSALLPDAESPPGAELKVIPLQEIQPNRLQPRREFKPEELNELADSIREKGIIQPLVVRIEEPGYEIIAGERRWRAARLAGLTEVPCRVMEVASEAEVLELSLIENLQREDLNPIELAEGYKRLQSDWGQTHEQIAQRVGKERATVTNTLRLLDLPEPIQESLRRSEITSGHAKAILALPGAARQSALWKRVVEGKLSVRQTEELARAIASAENKSLPLPRREDSPLINEYTDRLRQVLGTQVKINRRGRKGSIRIEFYSDEDLERLVELMGIRNR